MADSFVLDADGIDPYMYVHYSDGQTDDIQLMYRDNSWYIDDDEVLAEKFTVEDVEKIMGKLEEINTLTNPPEKRTKFTKADIDGVKYAIDILDGQLEGGSEDSSTRTNYNRLKRLLVKLQN